MTRFDVARRRLKAQRIAGPKFERPGDAVGWLGAVQAQDFLGSLWAVGLRLRQAVAVDIERAIAERTIIRTWPMRGTLHFVAAADVRWMLELLTPRVVAGSARRLHQQFGLDDAVFARSKELFARALQGGRQLSRQAMYESLEAARISTADGRGLHILSRLAQEGLICFGAREGRQQTFALLDEWAPEAKSRGRDESLAELAGRYFTSHGPATLQDFAWWSGLTAADARAGLEMAKPRLAQEVIDGRAYWLAPAAPAAEDASPAAYLLPAYDEYTVAYEDRGAVLSRLDAKREDSGHGILSPTIVVDSQVVGTWRRTLKRDAVVVTPSPFAKLNGDEARAVAAAAGRYGEFLGASVVEVEPPDRVTRH